MLTLKGKDSLKKELYNILFFLLLSLIFMKFSISIFLKFLNINLTIIGVTEKRTIKTNFDLLCRRTLTF